MEEEEDEGNRLNSLVQDPMDTGVPIVRPERRPIFAPDRPADA